MQQVTPYLLYEDGEAAIEFLTRAFGLREVDRAIGGAGGLHVELDLEARPRLRRPTAIRLREPGEGGANVACLLPDRRCRRRISSARAAAGAEIVEAPNDLPHGHRRYGCRDPQGHEWFFAHVLELQ